MALPCPAEKAKNFGKTMKTLFSYLAPYKFRVAMVFLFAVLSTVFTIISPTVLGAATDKVVEGIMAATGVDFGGLLNILMALLADVSSEPRLRYVPGLDNGGCIAEGNIYSS